MRYVELKFFKFQMSTWAAHCTTKIWLQERRNLWKENPHSFSNSMPLMHTVEEFNVTHEFRTKVCLTLDFWFLGTFLTFCLFVWRNVWHIYIHYLYFRMKSGSVSNSKSKSKSESESEWESKEQHNTVKGEIKNTHHEHKHNIRRDYVTINTMQYTIKYNICKIIYNPKPQQLIQ